MSMMDETEKAAADPADISNEDIFKVLRHHASLFRQVDEILAVLVTVSGEIDARLSIVERVVAALAVQYPIDANVVAEALAKLAEEDSEPEAEPLHWVPPTGQYL